MRLARLVATLKDPNTNFAFGTGHANPLVLAVLADDVDLLRTMIARGGTFGTAELKNRAMYIAAQSDGPAMIQTLARHGVSPDSHARGRFTPLMIAAWNDRAGSVRTLLKLGADPNIKSSGGNSALAGAVFCRDAAMVSALMAHGAKPDGYIRQIEKRKGTHLIADARPVSQGASSN
jgi:ankyrin repeat protein